MPDNDKLLTPTGIIALVALVVLTGWLMFRPRSDLALNNQSNNQNINATNDMTNNDTTNRQPDFPPPVETSSLFPEGNEPGYIVAPMGSVWVKVNDDWELRLDSVTEDSRCPEGVVCEWSGIAQAKVEFKQANIDNGKAYLQEMEVSGLNRFPPTNELKPTLFKPVRISGKDLATGRDVSFTIAMVDLSPYPKHGEDPNQKKNYVAQFKIIDNQ